eukprot:gene8826-13678_t
MLHNVGRSEERIAVCSRPLAELEMNFCDFEGNPINLAHPVVLRGKMGAMQEQLTGVDDSAVISGRQFKGLAGGLNTFMESEYLLVSYRDYSPWALKKFSEDASGSWINPFGKKFVRKYFAIEVGSQPGTFIPITKGQFLAGTNKLHRDRMSVEKSRKKQAGLTQFDGLSAEQFNAVSNIKEPEADIWHGHSQSGHRGQRRDSEYRTGNSVLDTIISYTPLGWYRRVRDETYRTIGSALVSAVFLGFATWVFYRYCIKPFVGAPERVSYNKRRSGRAEPASAPGLPYS